MGLWWRRGGDAPLRRAVERGLAPVAVGLIFAGVSSPWRSGDASGWLGIATIAVCTVALLRGASPYLVMLAAALAHVGLRGALG